MSQFKSKKELRLVIDQVISSLSEDDVIGPKLRELGTPMECTFSDFDVTVNVRAGEDGESNLVWVWSKKVKWEPTTRIECKSEVANKFLQGKLRVAAALAMRKVKVGGSLTAGLKVVTICHPMFGHYREHIEEDYPHLMV
ncbi:MAG: hypothetical protein WAP35_04050 [Solirubrobacterales bacterium]